MADQGIKYTISLNDQATAQWNKFTSQIDSGVKRISGQFQQFGSIVAGAFSVYGLEKFVAASNESELASAQLGAALKAVGAGGEETQAQMLAFSAAMQKTTVYSDEVVTRLQAMLVSMTGLHGQALNPLTKAVLDLSAGMHISIEAATRMIGKTQEGAEGLKRMGITIGETHSEGERLAKITEVISSKFGGLAEAAGNTGAGKIAQFKNAINDLEEKFGDIIKKVLVPILPILQSFFELVGRLPVPIIATAISVGVLTAAFAALNVTIVGNPIVLTLLGITGALVGVTAATQAFNEQRKKDVEVTGLYRQELENNKKAVDELTESGKTYSSVLAVTDKQIKEVTAHHLAFLVATGKKDFADALKLSGDMLEFLKGKTTAILPVEKAHVASLQEMRNHVSDLNGDLLNLVPGEDAYMKKLYEVIVAQTKLDDETKKYQETVKDNIRLKKFGDALSHIDAAAKALTGTVQAMPDWKSKIPDHLPKIDTSGFHDSMQEMQDDVKNTIAEIHGFGNAFPIIALANQLAWIEKALENALLTPLQKAQLQMQKYHLAFTATISKISAFTAQANQKEISDLEEKKRVAIQGIDERLKNEQLSAEERKKLEAEKYNLSVSYDNKIREAKRLAFQAQKEADVIQAIMNTAVAVTQALPNFILAGIVGAMGAAEVALIASQPTPAFAQGGSFTVPPGYENDSFPMRVQSGERVTVQTSDQQVGSAVNNYFNFSGNFATKDAFKDIVQDGMRELGITDVNDYFKNNRAKATVLS